MFLEIRELAVADAAAIAVRAKRGIAVHAAFQEHKPEKNTHRGREEGEQARTGICFVAKKSMSCKY